ncbi:serine/arginine repetitive matrix protein 1-like [Physeter macrocephalus]|uniref:Serine/arginine repetitive matrix protein 1-like n=1 Tax=Physeter macrocephalus TaxID=9755 RepID=A0A9W2WI54_PHYMC|nr:serine/arginine repetitive matrix protein 1-like [Physeter catodon]
MGALCPMAKAAGGSHEAEASRRASGPHRQDLRTRASPHRAREESCRRREEPEPDVQRRRTAGGEPPPRRRSLPSFPARRPARSSPYLPAPRLPRRPARGRVARKAGWRAGGRCGYPAPDMSHPTRAPLPPGRQVKEEEAAEGAGARGAVEGDPGDPSVPAALRHAGTVLPRRSLAPHGPSGSRCARAPAQRPTACSATPGGWEGPLHPDGFPPTNHCRRTLTPEV